MKKLLILLMILGLTSAANALTLDLSVTADEVTTYPDEITIDVCTVIVIDITSDCDTAWGGWFAIDDESEYGEWYSGVKTDKAGVLGECNADDDWYWEVVAAGTGVAAGEQFLFEYHCKGKGDVTVTLYNYDETDEWDSITITQVPEPATMALLGLGGLLLRRRKR